MSWNGMKYCRPKTLVQIIFTKDDTVTDFEGMVDKLYAEVTSVNEAIKITFPKLTDEWLLSVLPDGKIDAEVPVEATVDFPQDMEQADALLSLRLAIGSTIKGIEVTSCSMLHGWVV